MPNYRSIADLFLRRVQETPDALAYEYPVDHDWARMTWRETGARVRAIACGLMSLGLEREQRCAILSTTRIEWVLADLGIVCAGGATTTIYPANTPDECAFILTDSDSRLVFVENADQLAKLVAKRSELSHVSRVITFEPTAGTNGHGDWVMSLAELEEAGRAFDAANPGLLDERIASLEPHHLANLVYTSGTTGRPKGVELVHDNWLSIADDLPTLGVLSADDHQLLWLPLAHSFGKVLIVAQLAIGYATAIDGRIDKLVENLAAVKPTFMAAAPRIFEKVHNKIVAGVEEEGGAKLKIFKWAMEVGREVSKIRQDGGEPRGALAFKHRLADKLVFSKIRARFGGRLRFFVSGSAPLSRDIAEFFHAAGITILEGYGLTETSAGNFINRPENNRFGTVGQRFPSVEVKIADDGEILLRGRPVMRGYHNLPDQTAEVFDEGGWFHTGDIGNVDADGFLAITDRKKDLIKTSGGKYVAPQKLELKLKAICPYVSQVVVHGNGRNFVSALITIDADTAHMTREDLEKVIRESVDALNAELARYETIKKYAILENDFTVETGELTASLKVKRKVVEAKYAPILNSFYEETVKRV